MIGEVRALVKLRERLVPYLADAAREAVATSKPLMRPLYFDHPADAQVWEHPLQWMLGNDILVAPVLEPGAISWPIYLPAGRWVDAVTDETVDGARVVEVDVSDRARIPVFVREDAATRLREVFDQS